MRIVPASPSLLALAMATLSEPVVRFLPAFCPRATLREPAGLDQRLLADADVVVAGSDARTIRGLDEAAELKRTLERAELPAPIEEQA